MKYLGEYRIKNPGLQVTEVMKSASQAWKTMTFEQKAPYNKSYEEAKAKYAKELEAYKASGKEEVWKGKTAEIKENLKTPKSSKGTKAKEAKKGPKKTVKQKDNA